MKKINIEPKLAGGLAGLIYYIFFILLEILTGFPFLTTHWKIVILSYLPISLLVYNKFDKTYNKDRKTENKIFIIIEIILLITASVIRVVFL